MGDVLYRCVQVSVGDSYDGHGEIFKHEDGNITHMHSIRNSDPAMFQCSESDATEINSE